MARFSRGAGKALDVLIDAGGCALCGAAVGAVVHCEFLFALVAFTGALVLLVGRSVWVQWRGKRWWR